MAFFSDILKKIKKPVDALKDFLTPKERASLQEKEKPSPLQRIETKSPEFEYKPPSFEGLKSFASSFIPPKEAFKPVALAPRETPEERAARLEKARETTKKIADFGKAVLRAGPRAAASVTLEAQGRRTMIPETRAEKFLFGQEPLESLTERVERFPERAKEFGIQEPTAKKIAPFAVLGLTALDILPPLPGKSAIKAAAKKALTTKTAKEFAKTLTKKESKQILKAGFKSVDDFFEVSKNPTSKTSASIANELKAAAQSKPATPRIPKELESFVPKAGKHKDANAFIREISGDTYAPEFRNPIADFWRKKYVQPLSKTSKATFTTDVVALERNFDDVLIKKYSKERLANMSVRQKAEIVNGKNWADLYGDMLENNLFKFQQDFFKAAKTATPASPTAALKEAAGKTVHAKKLETGIDEAYRALEKTGKDEVYNLGKVGDYIADPKVKEQYKDILDTPLYIKKQMHMGKTHGSLSVDPKGNPAIVLSDGLTKDMIDRTLVEELTHASQFKKGVRPTKGVPYKEIPEEIRAKKAAKHFAPKTTLEDLIEEAGLHRAKAKQFSNNDLEKEFVARQLGVAEGIEKAIDNIKSARPTDALKVAVKSKRIDPFKLAESPDYAKELRTSIGNKGTILAHQEEFYALPKRMKEGIFYHFTPDKKLTAEGLSGAAKRFDKQLGPGLYVGQDAQALKNFYGLDIRGGQAIRLQGSPKILDLTDSFKSIDDAYKAAKKEFPKEKYPLGKWVQKQGYDGIKYFDPIATGEEFIVYNTKAFGVKPSEALKAAAPKVSKEPQLLSQDLPFVKSLFKDTTERGIKTKKGLVFKGGNLDEHIADIRQKLTERGYKETGGIDLLDEGNKLVKDGAEINFEKPGGKAINVYMRTDGKRTAITFDTTPMDTGGKLHTGDNFVPDEIKNIYKNKPASAVQELKAAAKTEGAAKPISQLENESAIAELKSKFKNVEQKNVPISEIRNFPSAEGREIVENAKKEILEGKRFPLVLEKITEGKNAGKYKVLDGNYRAQAYKELGTKDAPAITQASIPKIKGATAIDLSQPAKAAQPSKVQEIIGEYQKHINTTPAKKAATPIRKTLDDTYAAIIDRFHPITKLARKATDLRPGENPELLSRRYLGVQGIAESKLFWNTTRLTAEGNLEVTGPGLSKLLRPAKDKIDDLRTLMIAERDIELSKRTLESGKKVVGTTPQKSKEVITALKQKHGAQGFEQLSKTALGVREWSRKALLDPLLEVDAISKEQYDTIAKSNKFYVPFQRVIEELETHGFVPKKANIFSPRSVPVKKLKGSTRDIVDPFESMITNAYKVTDFAERARVGRSIVNLRNTSPELAEMIKPIKPKLVPVAKQGEELIFRPSFFAPDKNTMMVFENGKRKFYQVPEDVFKAVSGMMESDVGAIMKVLAFPARTLRAGATLTPEFMGRNPLRDQLTAFVFSKYGYVPGVDLAKGIFNTVGKTDLHGRWLAGGGAHSMLVSLDRVTSQATLAKVLGAKDIKGMVKNPIEALRMLSEFGEKGTRVGAFGRAVKKGVSDLEAAFESRDITLDFARRGSQTRAVNMLVAFWNAQVQGLNKLVRAFRERPMQTTFKAASGITLPSVLLYLNNRNDPRYQELPQWQKDLFWIIPVGDDGPIIRIPKPFEVGIIFGTVPEHILTWLDKNDPEALTSAAKTLMEASAPGYIPTGLQPIIENVANYSFFRQRPIVSEGKQALPKELQADRYTSETAKEVGKLIKQSPAKIENLFVSYTGGLGKYALDASDKLLKTLGVVSPPSEPAKTLADRPFLRAFVAREPIGSGSESVNKFYKLYDEANATKAAVKGLAEEGKEQEAINYLRSRPAGFYTKGLNKVARTFSDLRKKRDAVLDSRELIPEQKKRAVDALDRIMTEIARQTVELVKESNEKLGQ